MRMLKNGIDNFFAIITGEKYKAFAALIVGFAGLILSGWQYFEKKSTDDKDEKRFLQNERQILSAKEQADSAKELVKKNEEMAKSASESAIAAKSQVEILSKQTLLLEKNSGIEHFIAYKRMRPKVEFASINLTEFDDFSPKRYSVKFDKYGDSPPINMKTWVNHDVYLQNSTVKPNPDCNSADFAYRGTFQTGNIVSDEFDLEESKKRILRQNKGNFVISGRICYNDDEGGHHLTDFCISYRKILNGEAIYGSCNGGNNSTTYIYPSSFTSRTSPVR